MEGPPLGPGGEDITWPDQVAPRCRKASSTRKIKPQTSNHVDVATKCSLLKRSCKKKFLQKQVKQIVKTCSTWVEVLQRLEKTFQSMRLTSVCAHR